MSTFIYMVRHGESPKVGNERVRGLTGKGYLDSERVMAILKDEEIDVVVSSPYLRSVLTVEKLADQLGQEVLVFEDLKERVFNSEGNRLSDKELDQLLIQSFSVPSFAFEGGESNAECQKRAVRVLDDLLNTYKERKVVIGTHGAVMTLIMGYYDSSYDLKFLHSTTKPDIYRIEFNGYELVDVQRLWNTSL